jgi:hypothetical protein
VSEPKHAEPETVRRMIWLLAVPIGSALLPWLVLAAAGANPGGLGLLVVGAAPLIGGLAALSFSFVAPVRVWPLVPYIAAGAVFVFVLLVASDMTDGDKLEFGPALVIGLTLPVLALVGALVSYAWVPEVEPEPEDDPVS